MSDPKKRISSHMNKDHQIALVDYVVVYGNVKLSSFVNDSAQITDVDEEKLTISYKDNSGAEKEVVIVWNHAVENEGVRVTSLKDVKAKLIAMAKYAAKKQGFSHVQIKKVVPPSKPIELMMYVYAVITVITLYDNHLLRNWLSGSFFAAVANALPFLAAGFEYFENHIVKISLTAYAIHLLEALIVTLPRTRKYRVPFYQRFVWVGMNFIEGFPAFLRLKETH